MAAEGFVWFRFRRRRRHERKHGRSRTGRLILPIFLGGDGSFFPPPFFGLPGIFAHPVGVIFITLCDRRLMLERYCFVMRNAKADTCNAVCMWCVVDAETCG